MDDHTEQFQNGGVFVYAGGSLDIPGIQHVVHRLGLYFKEHEQEEVLCIAAEYQAFTRGHGEPIEEAIARFDLLHALASS
eukprot:6449712-Prorocentrum_lima.AAC.1